MRKLVSKKNIERVEYMCDLPCIPLKEVYTLNMLTKVCIEVIGTMLHQVRGSIRDDKAFNSTAACILNNPSLLCALGLLKGIKSGYVYHRDLDDLLIDKMFNTLTIYKCEINLEYQEAKRFRKEFLHNIDMFNNILEDTEDDLLRVDTVTDLEQVVDTFLGLINFNYLETVAKKVIVSVDTDFINEINSDFEELEDTLESIHRTIGKDLDDSLKLSHVSLLTYCSVALNDFKLHGRLKDLLSYMHYRTILKEMLTEVFNNLSI